MEKCSQDMWIIVTTSNTMVGSITTRILVSSCERELTVTLIMETSDPNESPPSPLSTVPFPHDPDFVSRDGLLDQIHEKSSIPGSRIVIVGLGGVGLGLSSPKRSVQG